MTTIKNITDRQIHSLRAEAAEAGDVATELLCEQAIHSTSWRTRNEAILAVVSIINDTEARASE